MSALPDKQSPNGKRPPEADRWVPATYDELKAIAARFLNNERPGHTLQPTAIVNEAYFRLREIRDLTFADRTHFFAAAAGTIRRVLVDYARAQKSQKRGGAWGRVTLSGLSDNPGEDTFQLIELDDSMSQLAKLDRQLAQVVELRFFGGLTIKEVAHVLDVSATTVKERWQFARAWLQRELDSE